MHTYTSVQLGRRASDQQLHLATVVHAETVNPSIMGTNPVLKPALSLLVPSVFFYFLFYLFLFFSFLFFINLDNDDVQSWYLA